MQKLEQLIENLKAKDNVDAVFLTGSYGVDLKPYSDIDLIIILKENTEKINSLYTWIDNTFADIFFFDHKDLDRIENTKELSPNSGDVPFSFYRTAQNLVYRRCVTSTKRLCRWRGS